MLPWVQILTGVGALGLGAGVTAAIRRLWRRPPQGKGVFIRSVRHADSPQALAQLCESMGLRWVAILLAWQKPSGRTRTYYPGDLPTVQKELARRGIDVWLWAWPEPGQAGELVRLYNEAKKTSKIKGFIIDPEGPYYSSKLHGQAALDVEELRAGIRDPIGCTSYGGGPPNHPSFPWRPFATLDFGIPQIYDPKQRYGTGYPTRAVESWQDVGFDVIIPALAAYGLTPAQMRMMFQATPPVFDAAIWWDFYWLERAPKRQQAVADLEIPDREGRRVVDGRVA